MRADVSVLTLGSAEDAEAWYQIPQVGTVIVNRHAAADGRRFGSRLLGLGLDAAVVAAASHSVRRSSTIIATNPWIALAATAFGRKQIIFTGVYATPGSRHWRLLRRSLGKSLLVAWTAVEADSWRAAGGRARQVLYGNTFPYETNEARDKTIFRVFVGGSSDRDPALIRRLANEVLESEQPVRLDIAVGGSRRMRQNGRSVVVEHGPLPQQEFGKLMASSHVTYLPLLDNDRAAGHMLTVGSLQVGTPVVTTPNRAMSEYVDGEFVRLFNPYAGDTLAALRRAIDEVESPAAVSKYWAATFSRRALMMRMSDLLNESEADHRTEA